MTIPQQLRVAFCCLAVQTLHAQTANTSYQVGGHCSTQTLNGTFNWSGTSNLTTSNNVRASATVLLGAFAVVYSDYIVLKNFGFSIPSYASVTGIEVQMEKRATGLGIGCTVRDHVVRLVRADTLTGTNQAVSTNWTGTDQTATYGGGSGTWGTSWTAAEVNSAGFGVAFSARVATGALSLTLGAELDMVQVRIHYFESVLPVYILSFRGNKEGNFNKLSWNIVSDQPGQLFLEKRTASSDWLPVYQSSIGTLSGRWTDTAVFQEAWYRLRLKIENSADKYSAVVFLKSGQLPTLRVSPNPAREQLRIEAQEYFRHVTLYDLFGRKLVSKQFDLPARTHIWLLPDLPAGQYLLLLSGQQSNSSIRVHLY